MNRILSRFSGKGGGYASFHAPLGNARLTGWNSNGAAISRIPGARVSFHHGLTWKQKYPSGYIVAVASVHRETLIAGSL